ncbi:MAG: c-type cytochrome [Planctomycetes bacterium]|nr:c-type cytochrome [Planctomycetota bacterium]
MTFGRKIVLFLLAVTAAFVYICNAIPQIKSEAATEIRIGESPEDLVASGKRIFMSDRAQCLTCHSVGEDPKARCPNLEGVGDRAPIRKAGTPAADYLVESLYNPNAFVVPGYPRNQMMPVHKPPIALSHDEMLAVMCYLNTLGGKTDGEFVERVRKAQEPWRRGLLKPEEAAEESRIPMLPGDPTRGRELFLAQKCNQCHRAEGREPLEKDAAPDLTAIGASQRPEYILESILDPNAVVVKGFAKTTVIWKDEDEDKLEGIAREWIPDQERPTRLRLQVVEKNRRTEEIRDVDLARVLYVGDTVAVAEIGDEMTEIAAQYVSGSAGAGLVVKVWKGGRWEELRLAAPAIRRAVLPSPMAPNFGDQMTPREIFDLISYLMAQKGRK